MTQSSYPLVHLWVFQNDDDGCAQRVIKGGPPGDPPPIRFFKFPVTTAQYSGQHSPKRGRIQVAVSPRGMKISLRSTNQSCCPRGALNLLLMDLELVWIPLGDTVLGTGASFGLCGPLAAIDCSTLGTQFPKG